MVYKIYGASQVALVVKNPPTNAGDIGGMGLLSGWGRSPGGGHGRSLVGCRLWGRIELDTTEAT